MLMKNLVQLAEDQARDNQEFLQKLEQLVNKSPDGRIEMTTFRGKAKFFLVRGNTRRYLRRDEKCLIQSLLEKSYFKHLLIRTRKNQRTIRRFLKDFDPHSLAGVYEKMSSHRKDYVAPLVEPDEVFVQRWLEEHQAEADARPNPHPKSGEFVTMKGEVVRSKSEKIIADLLFQLGIAYVYECPLDTPGGVIYPDFTILDINTRETYYWEHRGLLDKADYAEESVWKTHLYAEAGIFPGQKLLFSEETANVHLRTQDVEAMIRALFL